MTGRGDLTVLLPNMAKSADRKGKPGDIDGKFVILDVQAIDDILKRGYVIITVRAFGLSLFRPAKDVEGRASQRFQAGQNLERREHPGAVFLFAKKACGRVSFRKQGRC